MGELVMFLGPLVQANLVFSGVEGFLIGSRHLRRLSTLVLKVTYYREADILNGTFLELGRFFMSLSVRCCPSLRLWLQVLLGIGPEEVLAGF